MKKFFLISAAALIAANGAAAQELSYGGLIAAYSKYESDGDEVSTSVLGAEFGVSFGAFDASVSGFKLGLDADGGELDADLMSLGLGYTFGQAFRVDASTNDISIDVGGPGVSLDLNEVGFAYDNGTYFGRLSYSELTPESLTAVDNLWGLHVGYDGGNGLSASVSAHWINDAFDVVDKPVLIFSADYDGGKYELGIDVASADLGGVNLSATTLKGIYNVNDQWQAYASFAQIDLDGTDLNSARIGGAYKFNEKTRIFADVARLTLEGAAEDATGITFGVSMDLGDKPASYETTADRLLGAVETGFGLNF